MTSFKQKIASKEIKRADAMKVRYQDLHEEPGFNLRDETALDENGETFEQSIVRLADFIAAGGQFPALEVRPRAEGGVWIVEGHRRKRAIGLCIERGVPLQDKDGEVWVSIVPFEGNDADRTLRIMTSREGRNLSMLETARGYARLRSFGWDNTRIGAGVQKSPQHVAQMLTLADANSDVHKMVNDGTVSAAVAVGLVRKHGEDAGKVIAKEADKARAQGKAKVTAGTIKGKSLPPKITGALVASVDAFMGTLDKQARESLASAEFGLPDNADGMVKVDALALLALLKAHAEVIEARQAQEAKAREAAAKASQQDISEAA